MRKIIFFICLSLFLVFHNATAQEKIYYETEKYPFVFVDTLSDAGGNLYAFYERNETAEQKKITFVFQLSPVSPCAGDISIFSRIKFAWCYSHEAKKILKEWKDVFYKNK